LLAQVHVDNPVAAVVIADGLRQGLARVRRPSGLVVVCVGTDRATGDALGPLTGQKLWNMMRGVVPVYGTLEDPVHATNLAVVLREMRRRHPRHAVIAVDACVGDPGEVGLIRVRAGRLEPGSGLDRALPAVGDVSVLGIVAAGQGVLGAMALAHTRLHLTWTMAEVIACAISRVVKDRSGTERATGGVERACAQS